MNRLSVWTVVAVAALVVFAAPASAASVASVNTTDQDFQAATLDGMEIQGSGESASVVGDVGFSELVDFGTVGSRQTGIVGESGYVFYVGAERGAVRGDIGDATVTRAYLRYEANGTLIESKPASQFGEVTFEHSFEPGVSYRITADAEGSQFELDSYSDDAPLTRGALTVSDTSGNGLPTVFQTLETGDATSIAYYGPEHQAEGEAMFVNVTLDGSTTLADGATYVRAQANDGSGWSVVDSQTLTSSGTTNVSLDISGSSASRYRAVVVSDGSGSERSVSVHDEGVTFTASPPDLSNPDPAGSDLSSYDGDISVDVSDSDFGLVQGDSVTVEASNSEGTIGSSTVGANGTVSFDYVPTGGGNNITWTATDSHGNSDTLTQEFTAPAQLRIYNESDPTQLVDNVNVTVSFYRENTDEVITKNTSNGVISMTGLPASDPFFVRAEAENYTSRTIYVPSLIETQRLYLLPEDEVSVPIVFDHADYSGSYPQDDTVLIVQRELNGSYTTIQGDIFGATGRFSTILEQDVRHRLVVENVETGERKVLGSYTPFGAEEETVKIVTNGTINVERLPAVAIEPSTRTLVASSNPGLSVTVDNQSTTVSSWSVNVTFQNDSITQLLASTSSASDGGTYDPNLNLSGYANGNVTVEVNWQTEAGETGGQTAVFSVQQFYNNQHSLLAVLGTLGTHIPGQNFGQFTTLLSVFISIFVGVGAGVTLRAPTELIGVLVVVTLAGFAVIGWVGYGPVFIGGAGLAAIVGLRRGL